MTEFDRDYRVRLEHARDYPDTRRRMNLWPIVTLGLVAFPWVLVGVIVCWYRAR